MGFHLVSALFKVLIRCVLTWYISTCSKQSKIKSLKLVGPIIESVMPIGTEEDPEDVDDESPSRVSKQVKGTGDMDPFINVSIS